MRSNRSIKEVISLSVEGPIRGGEYGISQEKIFWSFLTGWWLLW